MSYFSRPRSRGQNTTGSQPEGEGGRRFWVQRSDHEAASTAVGGRTVLPPCCLSRLLTELQLCPGPYGQGKLGNVISRFSGPAVGERAQRREGRVLTPVDRIQPKGP